MAEEIIENRIWRYRQIKGLNQSDLAFVINQKGPGQVSRYEKGLVISDFERIVKISHALEVGPEELYPELIEQWQSEAEEKIGELEKIKQSKKQSACL